MTTSEIISFAAMIVALLMLILAGRRDTRGGATEQAEVRSTLRGIATGVDDGKSQANPGPKPSSFVKPETSTSRLTKAAETAASSKVSSFTNPTSEIPPWIRNK